MRGNDGGSVFLNKWVNLAWAATMKSGKKVIRFIREHGLGCLNENSPMIAIDLLHKMVWHKIIDAFKYSQKL